MLEVKSGPLQIYSEMAMKSFWSEIFTAAAISHDLGRRLKTERLYVDIWDRNRKPISREFFSRCGQVASTALLALQPPHEFWECFAYSVCG